MGIGPLASLLSLASMAALCSGSIQRYRISPGFQGSEMDYIDNNGIFLLSNTSSFGFGFVPTSSNDTSSFLLAIVYLQPTPTVVWTANRASPVSHSDAFLFAQDGNAFLTSGSSVVWSTNTSGRGAASMTLLDSGNLVVLGGGGDSAPLWQSFRHPTDTLLSTQSFVEGMELVSQPNSQNLTFRLRIVSGDMALLADFQPPQPYWTLRKDNRRIDNKIGGGIHSATITPNSWNFFDQKGSLLSQLFIGSGQNNDNTTWAAALGGYGAISFSSLQGGGASSSTVIPQDSCDTPAYCSPYYICSGDRCQCPTVLSSDSQCNPSITAPCTSNMAFELVQVDDGVGYFATNFVAAAAQTSLTGCQQACLGNCSCLALFHDDSSGNCFLFDQIGSLKQLAGNTSAFSAFIKVESDGSASSGAGKGSSSARKRFVLIIVICFTTAAIIAALICLAVRINCPKRLPTQSPRAGASEEENFLENISGMPLRFSYGELQAATDNFSVKLGQGGFGSVYLGTLPDGTRVAVKKLEGIGQGTKEFRSEVSIIGSIHHIHLVKLRGFCAEGTHRLLAYEYMAKGSLDRWIFEGGDEKFQLDWDKRFSIALGTAKGLAYLHQDCESKIIHCDIKPENVLLDDHFVAKVSDFGLAKLMNREQSHVFTTLRGTRGYLAPEWITSYAISEKSDVYSYGMVLLEIVGGRKSFDPSESSEKAHFPSYAFKKLEEGKPKDILDARLNYDDEDGRAETAIKVALWCIQEDLSLRPSMSKVVQMLEGLSDVPQPPTCSHIGVRLFANVFKSSSEDGTFTNVFKSSSDEGTSSGQSDCNSNAFLSAVRLSGPR